MNLGLPAIDNSLYFQFSCLYRGDVKIAEAQQTINLVKKLIEQRRFRLKPPQKARRSDHDELNFMQDEELLFSMIFLSVHVFSRRLVRCLKPLFSFF